MALTARARLLAVAALAALDGALGAAPLHATPLTGPDSGRPVPRYESLKFGEVNGRRGPSGDQQILWIYHRRGLPVRVVAESGPWRRIEDPAGDLSWVNAAMLEMRRTAFVTSAKPTPLRAEPHNQARIVALLASGVIAQVKECEQSWRQVKVGRRDGWVAQTALWGADGCAAGG